MVARKKMRVDQGASPQPRQRASKLQRFALATPLLVCLFLAVLVIACDSSLKWDTIKKISGASFTDVVPGSLPLPPGAREEFLVLPASSMDAKWWVLHCESLLKSGGLRARHTELDNAPDGREVHWSSLLIWLLAGLANLLSFFNGLPAWKNVAEAALLAGPVMLVSAVVLLGTLVGRRFGWLAASVLAVAFLTNPSIYHTFHCGEADHHGIVLVFGMACILSLVAGGSGFILPKGRRDSVGLGGHFLPMPAAVTWFRVSGVFGAAALWISAATAIPILGACALGGIATSWVGRTDRPKGSSAPELWTVWGVAGCLGSLSFYALEYFPDQMGWRLEVNHPLYAFAWLGGGFLMGRIVRAIGGGRFFDDRPWDSLRVFGCVCLVGLPVGLIALLPQRVFWVSDPFLLALHQEYIQEFQNMITFVRSSGSSLSWGLHYAWPLFAIAASIILWWRNELTLWGKHALVLLMPPTLVMQALALYQVRWASASMGIWSLCVLVLFVGSAKPGSSSRPILAGIGIVVVAWFALIFSLTPQLVSQFEKEKSCLAHPIKEEVGNGLILRDIAHRLIQSSPARLPVVLSGPNSSTELAYHAGVRTLGTLYWENMPGLKRAAAIFTARDEKVALARLTEAGVTHIVVPSWDNFIEAYSRLYSKYEDPSHPEGKMFFEEILSGRSCPQWLRPFAYPIPTDSGLDASSVKIFAVIPEQNLFESYFYRGVYHWEANEMLPARSMFEKAKELRPQDARVSDYLARIAEKSLRGGKP